MEEVRQAFHLPTERLVRVMADMRSEMTLGLAKDQGSSLRMIPTFVYHLPLGDEKGNYFAIDLGGSNFRVLRLTLDGSGACAIQKSEYKLTTEIMESDAATLFGFIADCVKSMAPETVNAPTPTLIGFTFSFPVHQTSINSGNLIKWTKGFAAKDCVDRDVGALMQSALADRGLNVQVAAIVNDTVGTLMARAIKDRNCAVGVIFGTGTNACYYERRELMPKWSGPEEAGMIVNMEWGGFGDGRTSIAEPSMLPWTKWDQAGDDSSLHPTSQLFEKMISGKYQGEIVRQLIVDLTARGLLFGGKLPAPFAKVDGFATHYLSTIEEDDASFTHITAVFAEAGVSVPPADLPLIRELCELVSKRAARLSAAACLAVVQQVTRDDITRHVTIAVDGTVFRRHPTFRKHLEECIEELRDPRSPAPLFAEAEDGSGTGAALVVASVRPVGPTA